MSRIKRINDFPLNEGIFSSIGQAIKGKKSKVEGILKKIQKAREEDVDHTVKIEKETADIEKDGSPEYRFALSNLERQRRVYSSIKSQEINALTKTAEKTIEDDPKLSAFYYSELSKIQADSTEKMLNSLKPYKDPNSLNKLAKEFEDLVKDVDTKTQTYQEIERSEYLSPEFTQLPDGVTKEVLAFVEMPSQEASTLTKSFTKEKLDSYKAQLETWKFHLEIEYDKAISRLRKDLKRARNSGESWMISSLEKEEMSLRFSLRKPIDKIRSRISLVEREIKNRIK